MHKSNSTRKKGIKTRKEKLPGWLHKKYVVGAAFIIIFALVGAYAIFGVHATSDERTQIVPEGEGTQYNGATYRQGTVFTHNFAVDLYWEFLTGGHPGDTNHVLVELGYKPSQTTPVIGANGMSITCNESNVTCFPIGPDRYDTNSDSRYFNAEAGYSRDFAVCVEFKRPFIQANYNTIRPPVFSVTHKMAKTGDFSWIMVQEWYSGSCASPDVSGHGSSGIIVSGKCSYDASVCSGENGGTTPNGSGTSGDGKGNGTGTGSGGGSGGSTANSESKAPNTFPTSTSQGTSNQTDVEPSPFFDGKQYEPGSDPDILGVNTTFSIAGHNLKYGWLLVLVLLVLGGTGYYVWRKKPGLLKKLRLFK